ncbi:MAG: hypothetical protein JW768_09775 [Chitinispirillaceae bacterium]|nr:hypothetical protein [Chitinispirillaceae bacterium]
MTRIERTVKEINDLWLFYIKTSKEREMLHRKTKLKNSRENSASTKNRKR